MTFFSLLCALLLEQLYPLPASNPVWRAQQRLADWSIRNLNAGKPVHGWICWAAAVAAPALLAYGIYRLLNGFAWPLALGWNVLLLYATLSFRQFGDYLSAIREALEHGDEMRARQLLAQWQGTASNTLPRHTFTQQVLEHAVLNVHRHVFGIAAAFVLFSMLGLGPAGAVLYWCADCVRMYWQQPSQQTGLAPAGHAAHAAQTAWNAINWLPTRITAACFAVVGNFELAIDNWRQIPRTGNTSNTGNDGPHTHNQALLLAVAAGAIDVPGHFGAPPAAPVADATPSTSATANSPTPDPTLAEDASAAYGVALYARQPSGISRLHMLARLVWRSVLLWCLLIALVTVTHWVS